jgi:type I restriction enzyme, S subunit
MKSASIRHSSFNLQAFFQKFSLFADAPGAVARMRELVMWSAFSGAFSGEERNQPMPKRWAVEGGLILPALPSSWEWQRGSQVFDVIRGVSYKKNDASDCPVEGSFPVLRANNIGNRINFDGLVYVPRSNIRDEQFVRRGDILIAMSSGSKKLVGKAAPIVTDFIGAFGAFCGIIRNKSAIRDDVLARYFQSPQYTSWVTAAGRGIGINNLSRGDLDSLPVPTPPLAEQKRIVAKVDQLMALLDELEAQQKEREEKKSALVRASLARFADAPTPANLNCIFHSSYNIPPSDLRKSILTLAVQGKLVPQDPNDEPAEELLANINRERLAAIKERRISPMKPLPPVEEAEITYDVRPGRVITRLIELVLDIQTGPFGSSLHQSDYQVGGTPVINPASLKDGKIVPIKSMAIGSDTLKRLIIFRLKEGDIVMARRGEMGRCAIVTKAEEGWLCGTGSLVLRMPIGMYAPFLSLLIGAPAAREYLGGASVGTTMQNLNQGILAKMPVGVPPLAEQRRIVAKVDELMALVDELEAQLAASKAAGEKLLAALVAELTTGQKSQGGKKAA